MKTLASTYSSSSGQQATKLLSNEKMFDALTLSIRPYARIAGLMGVTAVIAAAYGSHGSLPNQSLAKMLGINNDMALISKKSTGDLGVSAREIFQRANQMHFFSILPLVFCPFVKFPVLVCRTFVMATILFSGTCYYRALTSDNRFNWIAPIGGYCHIVGWLLMML